MGGSKEEVKALLQRLVAKEILERIKEVLETMGKEERLEKLPMPWIQVTSPPRDISPTLKALLESKYSPQGVPSEWEKKWSTEPWGSARMGSRRRYFPKLTFRVASCTKWGRAWPR